MDRGREGKRGRVNQRKDVDSSQAKTSSRKMYVLKYTVLIFFPSIRKMYILKFPLMEIQSKILKSLNVLTMRDLAYSSLRMF